MKDDLISRRAVIEGINNLMESSYANSPQFSKERREAMETVKAMCVSNIATVYDSESAMDDLKELRQYHSIGTVEECQEAIEKQRAKKPNLWGDGCDSNREIIYDMYDCPNCGKEYELDYEEYKHCPNCGQAIDWSDHNG